MLVLELPTRNTTGPRSIIIIIGEHSNNIFNYREHAMLHVAFINNDMKQLAIYNKCCFNSKRMEQYRNRNVQLKHAIDIEHTSYSYCL